MMQDLTLKWKASEEKVQFARNFPGLIKNGASSKQLKIKEIIRLGEKTLVIYDDHQFQIVPLNINNASELIESLMLAKPHLFPHYQKDYETLEMLKAKDLALSKEAKKQKLLSSIAKHIYEIPSLKTALIEMLNDPLNIPPQAISNKDPLIVHRIIKAIQKNLPHYPELKEDILVLLNTNHKGPVCETDQKSNI